MNEAPSQLCRGVLTYGGAALRGEIRNFYTGNATYDVPLSGSQHDIRRWDCAAFRWQVESR